MDLGNGPVDRKWSKLREELEFTALDRVRAAAEKWGATITALTGLFGFTALVKGPGDVSALTEDGREIVGIALLVALGFAAAAVILTALAAQGIPQKEYLTAEGLRAFVRKRAAVAGYQLTASRWFALVVLLALATAIGYTWYGERAPQSGTTVLAIEQSGQVLCGTLSTDDAGGLRLIAKNGVMTPLGQVASMTTIDACP